ncbi:radical SAM protein [Candidatus Pacearchaeota archaeon]|nr:radical SAM protein [Candidatus Pacearchaeota archaeon]
MIFQLETFEDEIKFIADKDTGKWVLGRDITQEVIKKISNPFLEKIPKRVGKIVLNMGRECNLDCTYCLVGNLKEQTLKLNMKVGKKVLEAVSEMDLHERNIVFHGSEPMMNYKVIKKLLRFNKDKLRNKISFSIQSNGTLFTKENLRLLESYRVGIGISLDGKEEHQNKQRPYKKGMSSYKKVIKNMEMVKNFQGNISTITVVTKNNVSDLVKITKSYENQGIESVLFAPVSPTKNFQDIPNQKILTQNIQEVIDKYIKNTEKGVSTLKIRNLRDYLRIFFREKTTSNCLQCGSGTSQPILAIDSDGTIYPCDFFWGNEEYKIGNIFKMSLKEALISEKNMRCFRNVNEIPTCGDACNWKRFCGGGCPGSNVSSDRGLNENSHYCQYNKKMFEYIAKKIPLLHTKGLIGKLIE